MTDRDELLEDLAALEHRQWMHWVDALREAPDVEISEERADRKWARNVLELLEGRGIVDGGAQA
jgi:hypothetical protein